MFIVIPEASVRDSFATPTTPVNTLTDKALDQVQKTPLNIFWDYAEQNSKLARTLSYK
jgi:hypothetical protein